VCIDIDIDIDRWIDRGSEGERETLNPLLWHLTLLCGFMFKSGGGGLGIDSGSALCPRRGLRSRDTGEAYNNMRPITIYGRDVDSPPKHLDIVKGAPLRLPKPLSDQFPVRVCSWSLCL